MTTEYKTIKPEYYDKFACIMSACEDNCCNHGWKIYIDKETYNKYKKIDNPEFAKKLDKYITLVKEKNDNDFFHAQLVTAKEGFCPFQAEGGLCEIHRDLGEEYLSVTCRSYPRNKRRMADEYLELSVSMSCPEAVRVALFDDAPMEFVIDRAFTGEDGIIPAGERQPSPGPAATQYLDYGWMLREAAITIMQDRSCPVAFRIIIIAMMLYDAAEFHDRGDAGQIPDVLDYYCSAVYGDAFVESFRDAEQNEPVRLKMNTLMYITLRAEAAHPHSSRLAQLIERFDSINEDVNVELSLPVNSMEFYAFIKEATTKHWGSFLDKYEHVLENYLVNYMFTELFPMKYHESGLSPYHHAFLLAEQYAVLRMLICGNYDPGEGFSKQYITQTISQVAEINQHSDKPLKVAENYIKAGIDTPAHLYYLLL